jgi:hypothetical protein
LILDKNIGFFDEHVAHCGLIYHSQWARVLQRVMREYLDVTVVRGGRFGRLPNWFRFPGVA